MASIVLRRRGRAAAAEFQHDPAQTTQATHYVDDVDSGEYIEEGTIGIRGQVESLSPQVQPCQVLPYDKDQPEQHRHLQPKHWPRAIGFFATHECCNPATGDFERHAAGDQCQRVEKDDRGEDDVMPISRCALSNIKGAGQGGKGHGDR